MAEEPNKGGKKILRSPNHPAFDLKEAIAKIKVVFEHEKRSPTTPEVVVKHLGYAHTNGPGGRALSALRQYGLLDEVAGMYNVSEGAFSILHYPADSTERREALKKAAIKPTLYRELRAAYPDGAGSDDTLRANLLKRGFNPAVIANVIRDYRNTIALAGAMDVSYTDLAEGNKMPDQSHEISANTALRPAMPGIQTYSFALSPDARAELSLKGTITADDLELLRDHIELTIKALARTAKRGEA